MTIGRDEAAGLIRLARSVLVGTAIQQAVVRRSASRSAVTVNVTVYVRRQLRASMSGRGTTPEEAVRHAASRAAADARFGTPLSPQDLSEARVELWIRTASEVIDSADAATNIDLGFHGVELSGDGHAAYFKPSVALTRGLSRHQRLLDKLAKKAGLPPGSWQDPGTELRRTTWEHYCEVPSDPGLVLHLRRLRPAARGELTTGDLRARASMASDRLMRVQSAEGYYLYKFHPFTNRQTPGPGNLVRQAGCGYAMAWAADREEEPQRRAALILSVSRVIDALLGRVAGEARSLFIAELSPAGAPVRGKLGTLALTLAALQSPSLASQYQAARQRLVEAVLSWQRPDGSFRCATDSTSVADDGTSQDYFPGEALMALAVELRTGSEPARQAMTAALPWYRARFQTQPTTAFVPWQIEAWRQYGEWAASASAPAVSAAEAAEFVFEMADWVLRLQIGAGAAHPDLIGGYARPSRKPGASTATYTQAIIGAFTLARYIGDGERASRYRTAARLGLDFVRSLQITRDTAFLFCDPARSVGGTTASLSNMNIRCDYDQHALTAYLAALDADVLHA